VASPVLEVDAKAERKLGPLRILGIDVFARSPSTGALPSSADRLDVLRRTISFLSPAAARWLDVIAGNTLNCRSALAKSRCESRTLSAGEQQRSR